MPLRFRAKPSGEGCWGRFGNISPCLPHSEGRGVRNSLAIGGASSEKQQSTVEQGGHWNTKPSRCFSALYSLSSLWRTFPPQVRAPGQVLPVQAGNPACSTSC